MCRFVVYKGKPVWLCDIIIKTDHSMIRQCYERYLPGLDPVSAETNPKINADGIGLAWYYFKDDGSKHSCIYTSILPSPNDRNLRFLTESIKSDVLFSHIRASSGTSISDVNCHPFKYNNWVFMHNGSVPHFNFVKRHITSKLSSFSYANIFGSTDSEHCFSILLDMIPDLRVKLPVNVIKEAVVKTINIVVALVTFSTIENELIDFPSTLNFAVSDGHSVVVSRYSSDPSKSDARSLYYQLDSPDVIIASEPLTKEDKRWKLVPTNHIISVTEDNQVSIDPIITPENIKEALDTWEKKETISFKMEC